MQQEVQQHIDQALELFTSDPEVMKKVVDAQKVFADLTGTLDDTQDEYEGRLQNFNEWFLFDYIPENGDSPFIKEYLRRQAEISSEIRQALTNVHYSLYEYSKKKFSSKVYLKDVVRGNKFVMRPENFTAPVMPDEIFAGRILNYDNQVYLLQGIRYIPKQVKNTVLKQAKLVRKLGNPSEEFKFVLKLEKLKTRWLQYNHMSPEKIFNFNS